MTSSTSLKIQEGRMLCPTNKYKYSCLYNRWVADLSKFSPHQTTLILIQPNFNMYGNQFNNAYPNMDMPMGSGQAMIINGQPIGMVTTNGLFNNNFLYSGNSISLQAGLQSLTPAERGTVRDATINCTGTQLTEMDVCCFVCTIFWGACLIFPLCFMCCDWWRKKTFPSFDVPESTYRALQNLTNGTNIQNMTLTVVDNRFNSQKAQILLEILSRSHLKGFTFINQAMDYDFENHEYSHFVENMRPIKMLPISTQIRWGRKLVI